DRPKSGRQRAQLNAFDSALLNEGDRILEVVMTILRPVGGEDSARGQRLAVNRFDNAKLVGADFDKRHLANDALKRILDQMQSRLQHLGLYTHLALRCNYAARRHFGAKVAALLDRDFTRSDVHKDAP